MGHATFLAEGEWWIERCGATQLLGCKDQRRGERRGLVVFGPGWANRPSKVCDAALDPDRCLAECRVRSLFELSLPDRGDGNLQIFTSLASGVAKEFAFRRVNQRV